MPYFVYILAKAVGGFTAKHDVDRLVYYEVHEEILAAIGREKALKRWRRRWKLALIEQNNPAWNDLYDQLNA